jgi:ElaB/YqjD/DUF883 family membrane-anchored ribosome-binding protein
MPHRTESHSHTADNEGPDKLIQNIQKLMDEVESLVAKSGDSANHAIGDKLTALKDRLSGATDKAREYYTTARKKVVAGAHQADETIRSHPYESLAVALGVGVLLGALLRRRSD